MCIPASVSDASATRLELIHYFVSKDGKVRMDASVQGAL